MDKYTDDFDFEMCECKTDGYRVQHKKPLIVMDAIKLYNCDICEKGLYTFYCEVANNCECDLPKLTITQKDHTRYQQAHDLTSYANEEKKYAVYKQEAAMRCKLYFANRRKYGQTFDEEEEEKQYDQFRAEEKKHYEAMLKYASNEDDEKLEYEWTWALMFYIIFLNKCFHASINLSLVLNILFYPL